MMSGARAAICIGLAMAAGCASEPAPEPQPEPDQGSPIRRACDRALRPLDRYAGPEQRDGSPVPAAGRERIADALGRFRPRLRRRLDQTRRRPRNLLRLLRRAEIAARAGDDRALLRTLEDAWLVADRIGVPECHIGWAGRPS